jgi:hypothetical protein
VDRTQGPDAGLCEPLERPDPQLEIRIRGVLHEHRHRRPAEGVRQLLHGEGVDGRPRADPEEVDPGGERGLDVRRLGDLGRGPHPILLPRGAQPGQRTLTDPFEGARAGASLPDAGAEEIDARAGEAARRFVDLLLALRRTRPRYDERAALHPGPVCFRIYP